jgi:putative ABC transport system permease protein
MRRAVLIDDFSLRRGAGIAKPTGMDALLQDARFALRSFAGRPAFAVIAILTLALGIGANSAIFTVVNAVVIEPLPFPAADRLVRVTADLRGRGLTDAGMSALELFDYRDRSGVFEDIAGVYPINANLTEVDEPERVEVLLVSPSYFSVLGARPQLGRIFGPDDNHPGIQEVVVISDALWKRRFGAAPDVLGRKLRIDADWYTVVGVMPPEFRHPGRSLRTDVEMWAPTGYSATPFPPPTRGAYFLAGSIGRLKPGLSVEEAQQRLEAFTRDWPAQHPNVYPAASAWTPRVVGLQRDVIGNARTSLLLLFGAVGIVLLIACANIAGLLLARAAARQRELGIRRALGSGRGRLARLLITESLMLALCGGVLGLLIAVWGVDLLVAMVPDGLPRLSEIAISRKVVAFALATSIGTGLLFGLAPALQFSNPDVLASLKDGRSAAGSRRALRSALVVGEFALALVLLVGAALLVRSFWHLQRVETGFDGRSVLTAQLWLPQPNDPRIGKYFTHPARVALFDAAFAKIRELPGVEAVAAAQTLPLEGRRGAAAVTIEGKESESAEQVPAVQTNIVSEDFFRILGVPIVAGRAFSSADNADVGRVVIVNQELARRYFGGEDPVGRRMRFGGPTPNPRWMTIVGVSGNVRSERLDADVQPSVMMPLRQASSLSMALVVRTTGDPTRLSAAIGRSVRAADPDQPTFAVRTMDEVQSAATAPRRFSMQLLGGFALLALLLAAIGIYGVMAYLVSQRTREIGIRVALGARPSSVVRLVVAYALGLAGAGVAIGVAVASLLTRVMSGMLFQVSPTDPWTFAGITAVLFATALVAALTPARRAARVDPMVALRAD